VTPSVSNPDSNAKAAVVAPPTVTQYVPPVTQTPTPQAYEYLTTTPGQTVGADVTTTDVTGQGGNVTSSLGKDNTTPGATVNGVAITTGWDGTCTDLTKTFCGGAGNLYSCHPILIGSRCDMQCGTGVSHNCAVAMGRPELKEGVTGPGLITYGGECGTPTCTSEDMQITCLKGHACVNRTTMMNYLQNGSKNSVVIEVDAGNGRTDASLDYFHTGAKSTCINGVCVYNLTNSSEALFTKSGNSYYVNAQAGEVFSTGQSAGNTINYVAGGANSCSTGTFQTMVMGDGQKVTTQLGGDRGACGAAGGCAAGKQRLCLTSGTLSPDCVSSDACSYQLQSVSAGQSCAGLSRMSYGEASKGIFVGCSNGQNCFCSYLSSASTVACYPDAGVDSCGAAGSNPPITTVVTPPSTPPTAAPTPTPTPTPTAVCGQSCGNSANGAVCTGTDIACTDLSSGGTGGVYKCVSTTCAPTDQDSQCKCIEKPIAPMCLGLYASTNQIGIGTNISSATDTQLRSLVRPAWW
jgi:hypothetical protein